MSELEQVADRLIGLARAGCPPDEIATLTFHAIGRWRLDCGSRAAGLADRLRAMLRSEAAHRRGRADDLMRAALATEACLFRDMAARLDRASILADATMGPGSGLPPGATAGRRIDAMSETPLHDFMLPRLQSLLTEAKAAGFERDPAVAVITDIIMDPQFNDVPLPPEPRNPDVDVPVPPVTEEYSAPSLGNTDWIKPEGQA